MKWSLVGGIVGTAVFFLLILVIGAARDGYSALSDEISQLGAAGVPGAWTQSTNFIVFGLLVVALAWGLDRGIGRQIAPRPRAHRHIWAPRRPWQRSVPPLTSTEHRTRRWETSTH